MFLIRADVSHTAQCLAFLTAPANRSGKKLDGGTAWMFDGPDNLKWATACSSLLGTSSSSDYCEHCSQNLFLNGIPCCSTSWGVLIGQRDICIRGVLRCAAWHAITRALPGACPANKALRCLPCSMQLCVAWVAVSSFSGMACRPPTLRQSA